MDLNWSHHVRAAAKKAREKASNLARSLASPAHKIRIIETCMRPSLAYGLDLMPGTVADLYVLQSILDTATKKASGLTASAPSAFASTPRERGGLGCYSLVADVAVRATQRLTRCLNDAGRLGRLTRALLQAQLARFGATKTTAPGGNTATPSVADAMRHKPTAARAGPQLGRVRKEEPGRGPRPPQRYNRPTPFPTACTMLSKQWHRPWRRCGTAGYEALRTYWTKATRQCGPRRGWPAASTGPRSTARAPRRSRGRRECSTRATRRRAASRGARGPKATCPLDRIG
jgi:hypothetical protein